jgi:hypothetical protein
MPNLQCFKSFQLRLHKVKKHSEKREDTLNLGAERVLDKRKNVNSQEVAFSLFSRIPRPGPQQTHRRDPSSACFVQSEVAIYQETKVN